MVVLLFGCGNRKASGARCRGAVGSDDMIVKIGELA